LAQVVYRPFALDNHDVELRGRLGLFRPQHSWRQRQQGAKQKVTACQTIEVLNGVTPNVQALQSQRSLRLG
jgi:hypothetical protein